MNNSINTEELVELKKKAHFLEVINVFASDLLRLNEEDEILWSVTKQTIASLGYVDCVIYVVEGEHLIQKAAHGPKSPIDLRIKNPIKLAVGQGICGYVAKTGKAEIVNDTSKDPRYTVDDGVRNSEITVPILSNGKVIAVIDSEHPEKDFYSEEDLKILETIANMVSVRLDRARAIAKIHDHKKDLEQKVAESTEQLREKITELKRSNEKISKQNTEIQTLLKETHHRVKNNLQIISSLLNLSSMHSDNQGVKEVFDNCKDRIKSMSLVHEQLYQKNNLSDIKAKDYLHELMEELLVSYRLKDNIGYQLDVDPIQFTIEQSVPFGLIVNELVVNALKHAFPKKKGDISIRLKKEDQQYQLEIADNGIGFDPALFENGNMGFDLVQTIVGQLEGNLSYQTHEAGSNFKINFPINP